MFKIKWLEKEGEKHKDGNMMLRKIHIFNLKLNFYLLGGKVHFQADNVF